MDFAKKKKEHEMKAIGLNFFGCCEPSRSCGIDCVDTHTQTAAPERCLAVRKRFLALLLFP
jgi:hypothetical protein